MDDELIAIQADLDDVLDRLADYMSSEKLKSELEPHPSSREDAARVVYHYASTDNILICSIEIARLAKLGPSTYPKSSLLGAEADGLPNEQVRFLEALKSVADFGDICWPLEAGHMSALSEAVTAWSEKECQFIGESFGLTLTPKREVDRRKRAREDAAWAAYKLHKSDPKKNPVDEALFEEAGKRYGMSARTVSRAYYSHKMRARRGGRERLRRAVLSIIDET